MKKIAIFINFLVLLLILFFPLQSQALTVSPAKFFLSADPGDTINTRIYIRNDLERTVTYYPDFEAYTTKGGEEPVFFKQNYGLPTWIETNPSQVTLGPQESREVPVIIKVPEGAEPGGHYAVIFWSSAPPAGAGAGMAIVTRVGALVLLEVSGNVIDSAEIVEFKAPKKFFTHLPVSFTYSLKNTGTTYVLPDGKVIVKNIFGKTSGIFEANPNGSHVLPDRTRNILTANWEPEGGMPKIEGEGILPDLKRELKGFALGYYRANLALEYGKEEIQTAQASFGFWVLPWRVLTLSILVLALLILGITKGIQKYNQWVIDKVEERIRTQRKRKK